MQPAHSFAIQTSSHATLSRSAHFYARLEKDHGCDLLQFRPMTIHIVRVIRVDPYIFHASHGSAPWLRFVTTNKDEPIHKDLAIVIVSQRFVKMRIRALVASLSTCFTPLKAREAAF